MGTDKLVFEGDRGGSDHCACLTRSDVTGRHVTFPLTFSPYFFAHTFFPYFFPLLFFPYFIFPYFFPVHFYPYFFSLIFPLYFFLPYHFFPVLFSCTFLKVATFEIQRFKISVGCFSSTYRYSTVHVPCGIAIQTSPVRLPLDGWDARMRDLDGRKTNYLT